MADAHLFTPETQSIVFGLQAQAVQHMLDFDYACRRNTLSVAAIVSPGSSGVNRAFFGAEEVLIPIYHSLKEATKAHRKGRRCCQFRIDEICVPVHDGSVGM